MEPAKIQMSDFVFKIHQIRICPAIMA